MLPNNGIWVNDEQHETIAAALSARRFVVVVTGEGGRVIRLKPQDTIGRARKAARAFRGRAWVRAVAIEEELP